jgi:tRNA U55 pseudouridine synthase TruB
VPAHLSALRRLASGAFTLEDAVAWPPDDPPQLLSLLEAARRALPSATLNDEGVARARTGRALSAEHFVGDTGDDAVTAWLSPTAELVALGQRDESGDYRVLRGFAAAPAPQP